MTPEEINRTIAEDRGWSNYLDEKNPGPAHELIEVLRGEGCDVRVVFLRTEVLVCVEFEERRASVISKSPTFCRAVCEAYLKVRGKWTD